MTPEQRFARWMRVAVASFAVLFVYFIVADLYIPMTPQARLLRPVVQVAPLVSGPVVQVNVANNSHVSSGDVLFRLDPEPFQLAVAQAQMAVEEAELENRRLDASLAAARAELVAAKATADELAKERESAEALYKHNDIARQKRDQIVASAQAAQAAVDAAEARAAALQLQRGEAGDANLRLRQARNRLAEAELNLRRTVVRAQQDGVVSNLQLDEGVYAQAGAPLLSLIGDEADIAADLREKSLRHVRTGDQAWITFDAFPGRVYKAQVASVDAGVREGQLLPNGQLVTLATTDRWVRDAQRLRLHVALKEAPPRLPASGARATVQLAAGDSLVTRVLGRMQIQLVSLLHYIY